MSELLEEILSDSNISRALNRVCLNKGAAGVDGITIEEIRHYMHENWATIKSQIKTRRYRPQPVRAVEIPKPNGGIRRLGIPTVMDRIIQQAMVQKLSPICEPYFADNSYGFRPGRSCEMAIVKVLEYLNDGYIWVVDIDLEKILRQRTARQAYVLCTRHHQRRRHGIAHPQIPESRHHDEQ